MCMASRLPVGCLKTERVLHEKLRFQPVVRLTPPTQAEALRGSPQPGPDGAVLSSPEVSSDSPSVPQRVWWFAPLLGILTGAAAERRTLGVSIMIPIYEQGSGHGIGHGLSSFLRRFDEICAEHLSKGRTKSFAFIFYDFTNQAIREVLKNQGVFAQLDRLSEKELSVFYLHAGTRAAIEAFNAHFFSVLGIEGQATLPCAVFFRVSEGTIEDVEIAQLESADLVHGFSELYGAIQQYLSAKPAASAESSRAIRWLKGGTRLLLVELFRAALKKSMDLFF